MNKIYTVARTVVYLYEIDAESEQQALAEVGMMSTDAAFEQEQITQEIINIEVPA
jgi:hypothetical protein